MNRKRLNEQIQYCIDLFEDIDSLLPWPGTKDKINYTIYDITENLMDPPQSLKLTMRMLRPIQKRLMKAYPKNSTEKKPQIWVITPQDYTTIDALSPSHGMMYIGDKSQLKLNSDGVGNFYQYNNLAVTGSGADDYWLANKALLKWLQNRLRLAAILLNLSRVLHGKKKGDLIINKNLKKEAHHLVVRFEKIANEKKNVTLRRLVNEVFP